ncbi:hypothetical protein EVAR_73654_1, partial [Eumeta japonica]
VGELLLKRKDKITAHVGPIKFDPFVTTRRTKHEEIGEEEGWKKNDRERERDRESKKRGIGQIKTATVQLRIKLGLFKPPIASPKLIVVSSGKSLKIPTRRNLTRRFSNARQVPRIINKVSSYSWLWQLYGRLCKVSPEFLCGFPQMQCPAIADTAFLNVFLEAVTN